MATHVVDAARVHELRALVREAGLEATVDSSIDTLFAAEADEVEDVASGRPWAVDRDLATMKARWGRPRCTSATSPPWAC